MILSQCLNLHKNFSLLFSIISLDNGKLKYSLQSFIISIFDYLNNFIKNRVIEVIIIEVIVLRVLSNIVGLGMSHVMRYINLRYLLTCERKFS